jgi:dihydrofolate reductase
MRKLKLQVQMSIDGFVGGPNGELDWMTWEWDEELKKFVTELTDPIDTVLLGKNMTDGFINHWKNVAAETDNPNYYAGVKFTEVPKVVFSKTLKESVWENTTLAKGDLTEEVDKLKSTDGNYMMVYGGASFVSSLIDAQLIDDYYLFINPVIIGKGLKIFSDTPKKVNLKLIDSVKYDCGITVLHYQK